MEFDQWAALMCEQYAGQQLSVPDAQTAWKSWAAGLLAIDVFINENIPSPYSFEDWQDWASAVLNVMNGGR
jgi:hypothetical protein